MNYQFDKFVNFKKYKVLIFYLVIVNADTENEWLVYLFSWHYYKCFSEWRIFYIDKHITRKIICLLFSVFIPF